MKQVSNRIILTKILVGQRVFCFLSVYAQQCSLRDAVKDRFNDQLRAMNAMIGAAIFLTPHGDCNDYGSNTGSGYKEVHDSCGYAKPDPDIEGERNLGYALAYDLLLCNTYLKKRNSHLITYRSGNEARGIAKEPVQACY